MSAASDADLLALRSALWADPWDELNYLALADALEERGRPCEASRYRRLKPSLPDVARRFHAYRSTHPAWGSLHVVLDDGNTGDGSVSFCVDWAASNGDAEGLALARLLLRMSRTQRGKLPRYTPVLADRAGGPAARLVREGG